ncbi:hypothetical protein GF373_13915 [bacterium]|nr:hypothetical protein [bacterium]
MNDHDLWEKDQDMLYFMGERDGKTGNYNLDYAWSPSYQHGYYQGKMMRMNDTYSPENGNMHLDNF